jgi:hypothetical protein
MNFNDLPNDILDVIYKEKHRLELNDVLKEITDWEVYKYDRCFGILIALYSDDFTRLYEPESIAYILSAMRNDGYLRTQYIDDKIEEMKEDILSRHYDQDLYIIDKESFVNDNETTLQHVLNYYDKNVV